MKRVLIPLILSLCGLSLSPRAGVATPQQDFYIKQALDRYYILPEDAHTISTSGSMGPTCSGSRCANLNPAGLGFMKKSELSLSGGYSSISGDDFLTEHSVNQNQRDLAVNFAIPLGTSTEGRADAPPTLPRYGTLNLGYSRYHGDPDDVIGSTPDGHRRSFAYGIAPIEQLGLGYSFTFYDDQLHSELADFHSHARFLHVFGTQYRLDEDTTLGAIFQLGIGQTDSEDYIKELDGLSYPRQYTGEVGISHNFYGTTVALAFDCSRVRSDGNLDTPSEGVVFGGDESGNSYNIRLGAEHELFKNFVSRLGARWYDQEYEFKREEVHDLSASSTGLGVSTGIGYKFPSFFTVQSELDYGFQYLSIADGSFTHMLTLLLSFE